MTLYLSSDQSLDAARQTRFRTIGEQISSVDDLKRVVSSFNHTAGCYDTGYEKSENWQHSDTLILDVDGGCSIEEFKEIFNDYSYYLATSKSHQKEKDGKPPCDRFHVYFPLSHEYQKGNDQEDYRGMMTYLPQKYPFFDKQVKDLARFIFKSGETVQCSENNGKFIDEDIRGLLPARATTKKDLSRKDSKRTENDKTSDNDRKILEGSRNGSLFRYSVQLADNGLSADEDIVLVAKYNAERCVPPLDDAEVQQIVQSATKRGDATQGFGNTELGLADRLIETFGADIRYCTTTKKWFIFDGTLWERTKTYDMDKAISIVRELGSRRSEQTSLERQKGLRKFAKTAQGLSKIRNMLSSRIRRRVFLSP